MKKGGQTETHTEKRTHLHLSLLLGHVVLLEFVRLWCCSAHWRPAGSVSVMSSQSVSEIRCVTDRRRTDISETNGTVI